MTAKPIPLENLITHLLKESHQADLLWQVGLLLICGLASWGLMRLLSDYVINRNSSWQIDRSTLNHIGIPIIALFLIALGRNLLLPDHEVHLLNIAVPLLVALVLVRVLIYMLRNVFKNNDSIKTWERYIAWTIWIGFALHITGLFPVIDSMLDNISFESGHHHFSLFLALEAIIVVVIAIIGALWMAQLVETQLMRTTGMDPSLRLALIKTIRTLLLITGVLIALPAVGIDITVLSVFGGALGVGLGFGLQKIASNYVSGFIILLDRSIRPGDMVTVDNKYGEVSQLNTRYTLLRVLDGTEIIIPNETLMTSTVINHSFTKRDISVKLPIQVGYDSDLEQVRDIMKTIALKHPRVLKTDGYTASVFLTAFADSGINFELIVWISDPEEGQAGLRSELYLEIWQAFKLNHIEIPYPRRDIQVLNLPAKDMTAS
ncbi:MAG: mechanosensitive ion channel family protein [Sulfuriferula sp.]